MDAVPTTDELPPSMALDEAALLRTVRTLEDRVRVLEGAVAGLQDTKHIEDRITDRVVTRLPVAPPAPAVDPTRPPSLGDIALPLPSAATVTAAVRSSWAVVEVAREARTMFWMLLDRRYTMAGMTRVVVIVLLALIFTSGLWLPLSSLPVAGTVLNKTVDLLLAFLLCPILVRETCRYKEWRAGRG